jgi:YVTN family beta-propeller protein
MKVCCRHLLTIAAFAGILGSAQSLAQNAYITNNQSNNVSVINTRTNEVIATVPLGDGHYGPFGVAVSPDGRKAYIANWDYTVSVINTASNTVAATVATAGNSIGIAVSPDGHRVYSANFYQQSLSVIDSDTNTAIAAIPAGPGPYGVVAANNKVYVANWTSPFTVTVVDAAANRVISTIPIASDTNAPGLATSPDGRRVYVTNEIGDNVPVIDTGTDTVIATIPVPISISAAVSPDGSKIYIPNRGNHIAVADAQTNNVITSSDFINGGLFGVSVTPDGRKVFVANYAANTVSVIDTATNMLIATIPVGSDPLAFGVFIQPAQPAPRFAGTPGKANCYGKSVSALAKQYGGLNAAAAALRFDSVDALQAAIEEFCEA